MSLILDALKRAQEAKLRNAEMPFPFSQGRGVPSSQSGFLKRTLIISAISGVIILILALFLIISPRALKTGSKVGGRDKPAEVFKTNLQPSDLSAVAQAGASNTAKMEQPPTVAIAGQDSTETNALVQKNTDEQITLPSRGLAGTPESHNQQINFKKNSYKFEEEQTGVENRSEENSVNAKTSETFDDESEGISSNGESSPPSQLQSAPLKAVRPTDPLKQRISNLVAKHQIELPLALALMKQESNLNPYMVSKEGAAGLCQSMPATGRQFGMKVPQYRNPKKPMVDPTVDERFDPYKAMDVGFGYLRQLLDRYEGNIPLALSAYNAGMGRTKSHVARIYETTTYVSDVMTHYWRYQDEAVLQQAMAQLVANIKALPPTEPEAQEGDASRQTEDTLSKPSEYSASIVEDSPPLLGAPPLKVENKTASSENGESPKIEAASPTKPEEVETISAKEAEGPVKRHPATQDFVGTSDKAHKNKDEIENATPTIKESETSNQSFYHFKLGMYYQKQKKLPEAVEEYLKAIEIDPLNAEAHNNLGIAYKDMGELDKAIEEYQKVLAIEPKYEKAYNNLGTIFYLKGDLETAIQQYQKTLSINPKNLAAYTNIGIIYKKQKRFKEAINVFQKALAIDAHSTETHYNLALVYEEIGKKEEAILHYQKFIQFSAGKYATLEKKVKERLNKND